MNEATTGTTGGTPAPSSTPASAPASAPASTPASVPASSPAWYAGFSDPSLTASVKKFNNPESLAKSYTELEKSAVFLPKDNSREGWEKVWNRLGRPETPEGYKLAAPKMPEGMTFDSAPFNGFSQFAHSIGLSQWQAQQLVNFAGQQQAKNPAPNAAATTAKGEKALRAEWGATYDHNVTLAQRAVAHLGGEPLVKALRETGAGANPVVMKFLAAVGSFLGEENVIPASTPSQLSAKAEYDALFNDPKSAYWDRNHPNHKQAAKRMLELIPLAGNAQR